MRKLSDMVVLDESESEWLVSDATEPLQEALEDAEHDKIRIKELAMKLGATPDAAEAIELECRKQEKKHLDKIQDEMDMLTCYLCSVIIGAPLSSEGISRLRGNLTDEKQIRFFEANTGIKLK